MKRRWIICGFFIGLVMLSAIGWVFFRGDKAWQIRYSGGHTSIISLFDAHIHITWLDDSLDSDGWHFEWDGEISPGTYAYPVKGLFHPQTWGPLYNFSYDISKRDFLGFSMNNTEHAKHLAIPLWFTTGLSAAVLCLVWRKTRPKPQGFPVELENASVKP